MRGLVESVGCLGEKERIRKNNREIIIKNAIKGDKDCYGVLIREEKEYLYKMAYLYVKNEQEALEVLHETIYKGFLNIEKLKKAGFFKTWITRILINEATDHINKRSKVISLNEDANVIVEKESIGIEEKVDLYKAVDLLRDNYKTVIIMKYFNDMKVTDIAGVMEVPEGTVKTYLNRAKKELKDILREGYLNE